MTSSGEWQRGGKTDGEADLRRVFVAERKVMLIDHNMEF